MKYVKAIHLKETFKFILFFSVLILLLGLSKNNFKSVQTSVTLFISSIFPSLFPFILFTELILNSNMINIISNGLGKVTTKLFHIHKNGTPAIVIGLLCGYPMGSKTVGDLYEKGLISKSDANHLLLFVNNCNPAFILSTIAIGIFYHLNIGIVLLISHILSALTIGFVTRHKKHNSIIHENTANLKSFDQKNAEKVNMIEILRRSILKALVTLGSILGFIVIFNLAFSIIAPIMQQCHVNENIIAFTSGIFEVTQGCSNLYACHIDTTLKICLISFTLGFSGLCILFQIYSTISRFDFSLLKIIGAKLSQGIISFGITYILLSFTNICDINTLTVFQTNDELSDYNSYMSKIKLSYLISTFIIIFALFLYYLWFRYKNKRKIK